MKRIHLLPAAVLVVAGLTGCHQGQNANTTVQGETGNGVLLAVGPLEVAGTRIVAGEREGSGAMTATIVNAGADADVLESVSVDGVEGVLAPGAIEVAAGQTAAIGTPKANQVQFTGLPAAAGQWVEVTLRFAKSGDATGQVLVVPPLGFYEPFAPAEAAATPAP